MAKDYEDIGLNDRLQSVDSIPARRGTESFNPITGFESQVETGIITGAKVRNISWNKGQGGTLVLGGTNNVGGVFSLKDEGGTERISMDKTGMTVNDGSITIKDSSGSNVIDSKGLVSTSSFIFGTQYVPSQSVSSDGTLGTSSQSIILSRTANVLLMASGMFHSRTAGSSGLLHMEINGTAQTSTTTGSISGEETNWATIKIMQLPAGTHTYLMAAENNGSVWYQGFTKLYLVLGK